MATQEQLKDYFIDQMILLAAKKYPNNPELRAAYIAGVLASHLAQAAQYDSHVIDRFRQRIRNEGMTKPIADFKSSIRKE